MENREIVLDGTGHIAGRLGSHIAKMLLEGYSITVLCAESIVLTGPIHRSKLRYKDYLRKRCLVKPSKGPYHYKEPSKFFTRLVKRMVPHKTKRGADALKRLAVFEGIPEKLVGVGRSICPKALLKYKANPIRKSATYGELLSTFGWKYRDITEKVKNKILQKEGEIAKQESEKQEEMVKVRASESFVREVEERLSLIE